MSDETGPTVEKLRDTIQRRLESEVGSLASVGKTKKVGDNELVTFHPSGTKLSVKVTEIKDT